MEPEILILLAEDEQLVAHVVEDVLEEGGFTVRLTHSGKEAISVIDAEVNQLAGVVTDVRLGPGPTGWDVARHARERCPTIPVVYMTGDSSHEHPSLGVPDSVILQKPFAPIQLITAIASLINAAPPRTE